MQQPANGIERILITLNTHLSPGRCTTAEQHYWLPNDVDENIRRPGSA